MQINKPSAHSQPASSYECSNNVSTPRSGLGGLMETLQTVNPGLKCQLEALTEEIRLELQRAGSVEEKQALLKILAAVSENIEHQESAPQPASDRREFKHGSSVV